jgi:dTDP-4-amino-4,6-dideoxygalactose transaminase
MPATDGNRYTEGLGDIGRRAPAGYSSVCGRNTRSGRGGRRDALTAALKAEGIPTAIYYPIPLHRQQAYKHYPVGKGGVAVSDRLAAEVISLPMHAYLDAPTQDRIIEATRRALKS